MRRTFTAMLLPTAFLTRKTYSFFPKGDMLRAFRDSGTPAGNEVKGFMDRGAFVPDATTSRVLK